VKKAHKLGLNLSQVAENAIRRAIKALKGEFEENDPFSSSFQVKMTNGGLGGIYVKF